MSTIDVTGLAGHIEKRASHAPVFSGLDDGPTLPLRAMAGNSMWPGIGVRRTRLVD
jgi:hypothetical protein